MWSYLRRQLGVTTIERLVMATREENQSKLDAIADQLGKAQTEIVAAVQDLKNQVAAGQELDFSRLDAAAQELDDLNPDAVAPEVEAPEVPDVPETPETPEVVGPTDADQRA